jgi:hypothetical protein
MSVPKAPVDKNRDLPGPEYQIRLPWEAFVVQSIAQPAPMKVSANGELRLRISPTYAGHEGASCLPV